MGLLESASISITPEFALALQMVGNALADRVTGYTSTSATSGKAIRATAYTPQGADARRSLKSSSASDAAAGSGARKVLVTYLTAAFELKTEEVTLNGTTAVDMAAADVAFLEKMEVTEAGTQGGGNVGAISIYTQTGGGGSAWGSIAASDNQTFWAHHYVPAGRTCYLLGVSGGSTVVGGTMTVQRSGNPLNALAPQRGLGGSYVHPILGNLEHAFRVPIPVAGPDFVWLVDRPIAVTASTVYGTIEFVEF